MAADEDGIAILRRRYANGEITRKQYLEMRKNLGDADREDAVRPSSGKAGGRAMPDSSPARHHQVLFALFKAMLVLVVVFIAMLLTLLFIGYYENSSGVTPTANLSTTVPAQFGFELLVPQDYAFQLARESAQCGPPACEKGWVENFTVPAGSAGTNLTGSYDSQYAIALAVLTPSQFADLVRTNESSIGSDSVYSVYNRSASVDVHLAPGNYSLVFYYPGGSTDNVTITRQMALGQSASQSAQAMTAPSITPLNSTIRQGQSVAFSSAWSGGAYPNYVAMLYSSSALPCDHNGRLAQSVANLSTGGITFSPITPASSAYYCIYVISGYGTASPTIAISPTSHVLVTQSAGTTTVNRATTTVSDGGGPSYCGAGYVLGSDGYCYQKCGNGYCTGGEVCDGYQCTTSTTSTSTTTISSDNCPVGYVFQYCTEESTGVCNLSECYCNAGENAVEMYILSSDGYYWMCNGQDCSQAIDSGGAHCNPVPPGWST
jgi:hypothetical protein